tara:strand:+ start:286 stop:510 length:225 start_codon:yes stop_codon:yes gene_type:complete
VGQTENQLEKLDTRPCFAGCQMDQIVVLQVQVDRRKILTLWKGNLSPQKTRDQMKKTDTETKAAISRKCRNSKN